jgi:UDP-N-acetylglucosamine:LPS N-acetylglucosamine transferase
MNKKNKEKKRILILPVEVGNGHKAPSIAIKKSIERLYPNLYEVEVIDLSKQGSKFWYSIHYHWWTDFALRFPKIFNFFYRITDKSFIRTLEMPLSKGLAKKIKEYAEKKKPDIIVTPHQSYTSALSFIIPALKIPLIALDTDPFTAHYIWVSQTPNNYIVFSREAREILTQKGIDEKKIIVFDRSYPLDPKHSVKTDSQKIIRKRMELKDKITLLISFGGEGVGNTEDYLKAIIKNDLNIQVLVVCGRNEKIRKELEEVEIHNSNTSIKIFGFVENMQEFIQASDVVLGKPGASQTFECLIKKKPIIYNTYMENELSTMNFVLENKYGWYTPKVNEFVKLLKKLIKNSSLVNKASSKISGIKTCSDDIARLIVNKIKENNNIFIPQKVYS